MEDSELIALKGLREKLAKKAQILLQKLKNQEDDKQIIAINLPNAAKNNNNAKEKLSEHYERKLCKLSAKVCGIMIENVDKKWLHDNIYKYIAHLVTETLSACIKLTIKLENEKEFEICDIECHFDNIDTCYMLEIASWVQTTTKTKNFALLTSAFSQYNEQSTVRKKILDKLITTKHAKYKKCNDTNGGIIVYVHPCENVEHIYLVVHWSILFVEQTLQNEQYFIINPTKIGAEFAKKNKPLLEKFCKLRITRKELGNLWIELCSAVDLYKNETVSEINSDIE